MGRVAESIVKMSTDIIFGLSTVKCLCFPSMMNDVDAEQGNTSAGSLAEGTGKRIFKVAKSKQCHFLFDSFQLDRL